MNTIILPTDKLTLMAEHIEECRLKREQAWEYSEQNYYDATYQTALQNWDDAVEEYNNIIRSLYS